MTISFDLTGTILLFAGFGFVPGLALGLVGNRWLFIICLVAATLALIWFDQDASETIGREAIGHAIILVGTSWSLLVMTTTYLLVRFARRGAQT
jgi:Na+/phosphate symporter